MKTFRLAVVECTVGTGCFELQKHVDGEWIRYCIVTSAGQALEVVREKEPEATLKAAADLREDVVYGSRNSPLPDGRRDPAAKAARGWAT